MLKNIHNFEEIQFCAIFLHKSSFLNSSKYNKSLSFFLNFFRILNVSKFFNFICCKTSSSTLYINKTVKFNYKINEV